MPDVEAYKQTALDNEAIRGLAVRAAAETPLKQAPAVGYIDQNKQFIDVCGPHWLLDSRTERVDEVRNGLGEDGTYTWLYVLMPDGQLTTVSISSLYTYRTEGTWSKWSHQHSVDPMSDVEIESFDFAKDSYNLYNDYGRIWGNAFRQGGASQQKVLHASRGAGLSLLLENIRTGRAQQPDERVVPFSEETAETRTQHMPRLTEFHYRPDARAKAVSESLGASAALAAEKAEQTRGKELRDKSKTIGKFRRLAGILAAISPIGVFFASLKLDPYPAVAAILSLPWVAIFCLSLVAWAVLRIVEPAVWNAGVSLDARNESHQTSLRYIYTRGRWKTSAAAVLVAVLAIWVHSGRSTQPVAPNGAGVESAQLDTAGTDLGLAIPMSYPDCDDSGIVVIGNVTPPKERWRDAAALIQRLLEENPGASYLRTDHSCPSLRQADDEGNPIYAVYRPAGRSEAEVCAEVRAAGGDAYGKWLSTSEPDSYIIPC